MSGDSPPLAKSNRGTRGGPPCPHVLSLLYYPFVQPSRRAVRAWLPRTSPRTAAAMKRSLLALLAVLAAAAALSVRGQPPPPTPAATGPEPLRTAGDRPLDIRHLPLHPSADLPAKP